MADRVCGVCTKIIDGRSLILGEKHFHADCFVCKKCEQPLTGSLCQDGDDYYCVDCYKDKFAPKCSECKKAIEGKALMLGGDVFCPGCFACQYCKTPIEGANYKMMQGKRCCFDCEPNFCALKTCREYCPEGDRVRLRGAAAPYHVKCLACKTCHVLQPPKSALLFNSTVFCKKHYEEEKKTKIDRGRGCDGCRKPITGMGVLAGGKQWHQECLVCAESGCGAKLAKAKVFPSNGKVYCAKHKKCTPVAAKSAAQLRSEARDAVTSDPTYDVIGASVRKSAAPPAGAGAGQDTYDNGEYPGGAAGGGGVPAGEETYDNGEYPGGAAGGGGVPAGEETYDNGDYTGEEAAVYATAEVAVDAEATYDNGQYSEDAVYVTNAEVADDTYDNTDYVGDAAAAASAPPTAQYSETGALLPEATYADCADVGLDPDLTYSSIDELTPGGVGGGAGGPIIPDLAYADQAQLGGAGSEPTYADAELVGGGGDDEAKYRPIYSTAPGDGGDDEPKYRAIYAQAPGNTATAGYEYTETVPGGPPPGSPAAMQAEIDRRVKEAMVVKEAEIAAKVRAEVLAEQQPTQPPKTTTSPRFPNPIYESADLPPPALPAASSFPRPSVSSQGSFQQEEYAEVDDDAAAAPAPAPAPAGSASTSSHKPLGRSKSEHPHAEKKLLQSWLSPPKKSNGGSATFVADDQMQRRTASSRPSNSGSASPAFRRVLAFVGGIKPTELIQTAKSSDGK